jgi:SAM-dependent methyltransferase
MSDFYEGLAPFYHLIFPDWSESVARQGNQLSDVIASRWPGSRRVLDVSCGIGTQAVALATKGFSVVASDLCASAVQRAQQEAKSAGVTVPFSVCDMRDAYQHHGSGFDVVMSCDNSVAHLLSDQDLIAAFRAMHGCLRPGGGCLITVRDYEREERGRNRVKPYAVRVEADRRYLPFQVWDFDGDEYRLSLYLVEESLSTGHVQTHVFRSRCWAVPTSRLCELLREAGFDDVQRIDGVFYQPVLVGTKGA